MGTVLWMTLGFWVGASPSAVLRPADPQADYRVGAPLLLELEVRHTGDEPAILAPELPWPDGWAERTRRRTKKTESDVTIETFELEVLPFEAGRFALGPFRVEVDGGEVETPSLRLRVASNLPPEVQRALTSSAAVPPEQLETLAAPDPDPVSLRSWNAPLLLGIAGAFMAALAAWLVIGWLRRRPPRPAPVLPPRPAHELAREALDRLHQAGLGPDGPNPYFTEVSMILRTYLGAELGFDARESTVTELKSELADHGLEEAERRTALAVLGRADLVKFAKLEPGAEEARQVVLEASDLVRRIHELRTRSAPAEEVSA